MKSAGVLTSNTRDHHAFGASLAAMLLVLLASALASAQSSADTPLTLNGRRRGRNRRWPIEHGCDAARQ